MPTVSSSHRGSRILFAAAVFFAFARLLETSSASFFCPLSLFPSAAANDHVTHSFAEKYGAAEWTLTRCACAIPPCPELGPVNASDRRTYHVRKKVMMARMFHMLATWCSMKTKACGLKFCGHQINRTPVQRRRTWPPSTVWLAVCGGFASSSADAMPHRGIAHYSPQLRPGIFRFSLRNSRNLVSKPLPSKVMTSASAAVHHGRILGVFLP